MGWGAGMRSTFLFARSLKNIAKKSSDFFANIRDMRIFVMSEMTKR